MSRTKGGALPETRGAAPVLPTTVAEISARAGVSKSTVSRALKGDTRISAKTRSRIVSLASELGYAPNAIARSLATKQSQVIGFIGSEAENYWYQENIQVIASAIAHAGMQMMMFQVKIAGSVSDVLPEMIKYRLAGCIVIPTVKIDAETVSALSRYGIHTVLINRTIENSPASSVMCDQVGGARALAKFLAMSGHKKIAFVAGISTPTAVGREAGFVAGLKDEGVSLFDRCVGNYTFEDAYHAVTKMISGGRVPDAIFAANDLMAFGTIDAVHDAGLKIPKDVSVVGFDNSKLGDWPSFRLTTVGQPIREMMDRAVEIISKRQAFDTSEPETVMIDGELIIRSSARIPARLHEIGLPFSGRPAQLGGSRKDK